MPHHIYRLRDPKTSEVRYVGITNDPQMRFLHHLQCSDGNEAKCQWIQSLLAEEMKPIMEIIEVHEERIAGYQCEHHWITTYRSQGVKLLNIRDGNVSPERYEDLRSYAKLEDVLWSYSNPQVSTRVRQRLSCLEFARIESEDIYDIQDLFDTLAMTTAQLANMLEIPVYTLVKLLKGEPVGCERVKLVLTFFCWIYQADFTLENVSGITVKEKDKRLRERLQGPAYCWLR